MTDTVIDADSGEARIPLLAKDGSVRAYTLIDAADIEFITQWSWYLGNHGYAIRISRTATGRTAVMLHRVLLGLTIGDQAQVDHINRDRLDNRRQNLRTVTQSVQSQNMTPYSHCTSTYRGVYWSAGRRKWVAQVRAEGKTRYLGIFTDELEAAEAARVARASLMPFAVD